MTTGIVAFGCSFVEGNGLVDPCNENVAACVAKNLGLHLDNRAIGGSGLEDHVRQFRIWLDDCASPSDHLILIGLSDSYRQSFPCLDGLLQRPIPAYLQDPCRFDSAWPQWADWKPFLDFYFQKCDVDQIARDRYWWVTNFFAAMCRQLDCKLAMFHVWRPPCQQPPHEDVFAIDDMITWSNRPENRHMLLTCGHTNADANRIYSQLLTDHILQRKLV